MNQTQHKHFDPCHEMGLTRDRFRASLSEPTPRHQLKGRARKGFRQMRRDLNGAFGTHSNTDSANDMKFA
jgi:hypothetical protein